MCHVSAFGVSKHFLALKHLEAAKVVWLFINSPTVKQCSHAYKLVWSVMFFCKCSRWGSAG